MDLCHKAHIYENNFTSDPMPGSEGNSVPLKKCMEQPPLKSTVHHCRVPCQRTTLTYHVK